MDLHFIITLSEHRLLGYVFSPYLAKKETHKDYYSIHERISLKNLQSYEAALTPDEYQLVKIIEDYNDAGILKLFAKKKISARDFLAQMDKDLFENQIRPFIERRMVKCLDILQYNPVPVYFKNLTSHVYEDDRIDIIEEDGSAVYNFIRNAEGLKYFLTIRHDNKELKLTGCSGQIILNHPCGIVLDDKFFIFRDIDGRKLIPFFTKEFIQIPLSAEKKYMDTFVRNAIRNNTVHAEGFSILNDEIVPRSTISVERDLSGRYFFVLQFIYDDKSIYAANRKTEPKVTFEYSETAICFRRLQRNYSFENECIANLLSMGLVNKDGPYFSPIHKNVPADNSGYQLINWLNFNAGLLKDAGIIISHKLDKSYYLDSFEIKMEISTKENDWFDIKATVEFAGFVIPFSAFAQNIIDGEREFMLPDGRVMILPEEWFHNYRDILNFSKIEKDTIKLEKKHFPLLDPIRNINSSLKTDLLALVRTDTLPEVIPDGIHAGLRNYQLDGYSWLYRLYKNGFGGCLADDMGLGKTLQALTLIKRVRDENLNNNENTKSENIQNNKLSLSGNTESAAKQSKAALIIVPTSLVHNWVNEIGRFVPDLSVSTFIGPNRKDLGQLYQSGDIIITSYGILRNDLEQFLAYEFLYVVLDESQMIKNPGSKTYQSVVQLKAENRIVLTGTPIENSLSDLWAQINFLNPGLLGSYSFFRSEFQIPVEKNGDENKKEKLLRLISPFVMRRSKKEVAPELPPVSEQIIFCDMDDQQEALYEMEKSKARNLILEKLTKTGWNQSSVIILQSLTKLRQIANHPALVDENYFSGSGKYDEIKRNLQNLLDEDHKALIFSSFVKHLELIAKYLDERDIPYSWLTGETTNREEAIKKFQDDARCPFFLISIKAGGVGLNLTAADYVLILDPWWNPATEMQAISRAHRMGQSKHIMVYRFISRNTLEEKIIKLQERKSELADAFVNNTAGKLSEEDVMALLE